MSQETYHRRLTRLARSLATAKSDAIRNELTPDSAPPLVKVFVDGNLDKRCDKLLSQLEFVADAFPHFERLVMEYILCVPLAAYDSGTSDGERMLQWLLENKSLTPPQRDYVVCQQARHQIEELARRNRLALVRFQELRSNSDRLVPRLRSQDGVQIFVNPIRTWTRFHTTELLDGEAPAPADVLLFAVDGEIGTAFLELEGRALFNELVDYQPISLGQWAALSQLADRDELAELSCDLSAMGLVALG